jgi:predicted secreted protein
MDGQTVKVPIGKKFLVKLEGNQSTGYMWLYTSTVTRDNALYVDTKTYKPLSKKGLAGGRGNFYFYFTGYEKVGDTSILRFSHQRSQSSVLDTFSITILITEK